MAKEIPGNERPDWGIEDIDNTDPRSSEVAFFFGAGASIEAGVPDTAGLMSHFVESLSSEKAISVKRFLKKLEDWARVQKPPRLLDIELLLETLQQAVNWKSDPLTAFVSSAPEIEGVVPAELLRLLRDFIKERVMVRAENVKYLSPLRGFIDQYKPLNVFSANYDTAVEVFCAEHKLKYRDGFDEVWNPRVFEELDIHIKLFKIHGSVTWYRTDRGRFVKIPIMVKGSSVELFTKEQAELVMLYPAQKFEYVEPLFELTLQMKRELAQCRTLFVVGYSFRDEHIRRIFWDIARDTSDFYVVLINPEARSIYKDRLEYYDDKKTPSSLVGRVVCLPYQFGKALPLLQPVIYRVFRQMRAEVDKLSADERRGKVAHWQNCILPAGECGDYETLRVVLEKVTDQKYSNYQALITSIALALFHAISNNDEKSVIYFFEVLRSEVLEPSKTTSLSVERGNEGNFLRPSLLNGRQSTHQVRDAFAEARKGVIIRLGWVKANERHQALIDLFAELINSMRVWENGNARFDDYLENRDTFMGDNLKMLLNKLSRATGTVWEGKERRGEIELGLRDAEQKVLINIFFKYAREIMI